MPALRRPFNGGERTSSDSIVLDGAVKGTSPCARGFIPKFQRPRNPMRRSLLLRMYSVEYFPTSRWNCAVTYTSQPINECECTALGVPGLWSDTKDNIDCQEGVILRIYIPSSFPEGKYIRPWHRTSTRQPPPHFNGDTYHENRLSSRPAKFPSRETRLGPWVRQFPWTPELTFPGGQIPCPGVPKAA